MKINWPSVAIAVVATILGAAVVFLGLKFAGGPMQPPASAAAPETPPPPPHAALPHMQVQAQYGGPLQDTLIQRLRDPIDGTICYLYLPIAVHHTQPGKDTGYVEYGANSVGSISCYLPLALVHTPPAQRPAP
jgi:hypothetical protein